MIQQDINRIVPDLREAHKDDFFQPTGRFFADRRGVRKPGQRPGESVLCGVYLQTAPIALWHVERGEHSGAETACGEIEFIEKSNSASRETIVKAYL